MTPEEMLTTIIGLSLAAAFFLRIKFKKMSQPPTREDWHGPR